jgi:nucleoside phosphorylase
MKSVALIMAMAAEATPVLRQLGLVEVPPPWNPRLPMRPYRGMVGRLDVTLTVCGRDPAHGVDLVATQPAVLATFLAIEHFRPDLIINAGTAGGFRDMGANIGDVYLGCDAVFFHDRRIPIEGFDRYGLGGYRCADFSAMARSVALKSGRISTGNSLDVTERDVEIMRANQITVKDMEAASVCWVAGLFGTPVLCLKAITDWVDHHESTAAQFDQNFANALGSLVNVMPGVLKKVEETL